GHLLGGQLRRERMRHVHAELKNERLHRGGIFGVCDLEPEGLALLYGGVNFWRAPGVILVECMDGAEEVDGSMRPFDNPEGGLGCEAERRRNKDDENDCDSSAEFHRSSFQD